MLIHLGAMLLFRHSLSSADGGSTITEITSLMTQTYTVHSFRHTLCSYSLTGLKKKKPRIRTACEEHFNLALDKALSSSGQRAPSSNNFVCNMKESIREKTAVIEVTSSVIARKPPHTISPVIHGHFHVYTANHFNDL